MTKAMIVLLILTVGSLYGDGGFFADPPSLAQAYDALIGEWSQQVCFGISTRERLFVLNIEPDTLSGYTRSPQNGKATLHQYTRKNLLCGCLKPIAQLR